MNFKGGFGLICHMITPSILALPIHVFWTCYVFLEEFLDLVCGKQFFGLNFRLIDQHLVLVWADLHLFLAIFTTIFG